MLVTPITNETTDGQELDLTVGRIYEVLEIEADDYRILTDEDTAFCANDPVLFSPEYFRILDVAEPEFWANYHGDDGARYAGPADWLRSGFFEDYHDHVQDVQDKFWKDLRRLYPRSWRERVGAR